MVQFASIAAARVTLAVMTATAFALLALPVGAQDDGAVATFSVGTQEEPLRPGEGPPVHIPVTLVVSCDLLEPENPPEIVHFAVVSQPSFSSANFSMLAVSQSSPCLYYSVAGPAGVGLAKEFETVLVVNATEEAYLTHPTFAVRINATVGFADGGRAPGPERDVAVAVPFRAAAEVRAFGTSAYIEQDEEAVYRMYVRNPMMNSDTCFNVTVSLPAGIEMARDVEPGRKLCLAAASPDPEVVGDEAIVSVYVQPSASGNIDTGRHKVALRVQYGNPAGCLSEEDCALKTIPLTLHVRPDSHDSAPWFLRPGYLPALLGWLLGALGSTGAVAGAVVARRP